eukprot:scaffold579309_cov98-Attheya_sp.AAC.1
MPTYYQVPAAASLSSIRKYVEPSPTTLAYNLYRYLERLPPNPTPLPVHMYYDKSRTQAGVFTIMPRLDHDYTTIRLSR